MRKHTRSSAFLCLVALMAPVVGFAEQLQIEVNGMVCSFCAQGITKKFQAHPSVAKVDVSLEKKLVKISTKPDLTVSDDEAKKLIEEAGYTVVKIDRTT